MSERFERHRQPWRQDEIQKLHTLASKGMRPIWAGPVRHQVSTM